MPQVTFETLIVSADLDWNAELAQAIRDAGARPHVERDGLAALRKLRRQVFHLVIVDDSLDDYGPLEFCLHLRDLADAQPVTVLAGDGLSAHERIWPRCGVRWAGQKHELDRVLPEVVEEARGRCDQ